MRHPILQARLDPIHQVQPNMVNIDCTVQEPILSGTQDCGKWVSDLASIARNS